MKLLKVSAVALGVLFAPSAHADVLEPSMAYVEATYKMLIKEEGTAPYVEFVWSGGTFHAFEYNDPKGEWCRGGSFDDLLNALHADTDNTAGVRIDTNDWSDICPNGTYICVATEQDEPDGGGFCGAIDLRSP